MSGSIPARASAETDDLAFADVEEFVVWGSSDGASLLEPEPIEMQVIDRLEIEAQPNLSAADAVAKLPGIRTSQRIQGERAAVSIEGLPPEYTRILVDGQRYTGFVGGVADLEDVPLTNLQQLEIQRGAQGLRQGPDSGGGVINIRTQGDDAAPVRADVWGLVGSDDKALLAASVGANHGRFGRTALSFTHDQLGGYNPRGSDAVFVNVGGRDSVRRVNDVYATQLFGDLSDSGIGLRFGYREEEERYVSPDGESIGGSRLGRWLGSVEGTLQGAGGAAVRTALTYYQVGATSEIGRRAEVIDREARLELGVTQSWVLPFADLDLSTGVDVRQLVFDLEEAPLGFTPAMGREALTGDRDFQKRATTGGGYFALDAAFSDWLSLTIGGRVQLDTRFDVNFSPQAGILLEPTDWLKLRAQYGRSDRYPSLNDLFQPAAAQLGGVYFLAGNPDLEPEQADSWRAGVELSFGNSLRFSATGFWNEIDGLIRSFLDASIQTGVEVLLIGGPPFPPFCPVPGEPLCSAVPIPTESPVVADLFRKQNLDFVRTRGVEAQFQWAPREWMFVRAGYTYTQTRIKSKTLPALRELPNEPPHTVDLELRLTAPGYKDWLGQSQLSAVARFRSTALRETSGTGLAGFTSTDRSSSSWIVDLRAQIPIAEVVTLNFDVRNLTNERTVDSNEIRGRTFFGGLRFRWPVD